MQHLCMASNNLGMAGAEYLASVVPEMKNLKRLFLNDCQLTDRGVRQILNNLEETCALETLDMSGNLIG